MEKVCNSDQTLFLLPTRNVQQVRCNDLFVICLRRVLFCSLIDCNAQVVKNGKVVFVSDDSPRAAGNSQ